MADLSYTKDNQTMDELLWFSFYGDVIGFVLFTIIALVGIFANSVVVIMVCRHKQLRTAMNYFVTNLAIADLILLVVLVGSRDINFLLGSSIFSNKISSIAVQYIQHVCIQATALLLAIMSVSRFTMTTMLMKAKVWWTVQRVWMCCGAAWFISAVLYIPVVCGILYIDVGDDLEQPLSIQPHTKIFAGLKLVFIFILPFMVIVVCYSHIIITFRKQQLVLQTKRSANFESKRTDDGARRLTRMVLLIIMVFLISWGPIQGWITYLTCRQHTTPTSPTHWRSIVVLGILFKMLAYLGSAINPFIYAYTNPSFMKYGMLRLRKSDDSVATQSSNL